ncbi:hypothetical protein DSL72_006321 [Monilinia vaccinii-corymbosi]|uniref:ZZ-type domain-containing protein n=1 Tax=Monilinia vaccinii-corymbosi TaxID=61207 RepID=A0A8A3PLX3_9HELO|nr:hypothetical protein DSL72_006321 [Monilinia vaccinii-corymbosi]
MSASSTTAPSTLSRSRGAILALTTCVAAYGIFYVYSTYAAGTEDDISGSGLHRSNAVHRRRRTETNDDNIAAQLRPLLPGEDDDANIVARPLTDGDTVVNDSPENEDEFGLTGRAPTAEDERNGQNIVQLLFRVSEDATRRNAYVHRGCGCNACGVVPIRGIRYRCANCADFDLCESCEAQGVHTKTHIFYKVRIPAPSFGPRQIQPVWYCGEPDNMDRVKILPKELITKYSRETGFERPELEAYFEQWNFMANTPWPEDPDDIRLAMDRRTFDRCLVPSGGYRNNTPSLIFDRMFAFYDRNRDDLISFPEFLRGQAYRKQKDKWRVIFAGYDIDDDGYVDRKDFLRMYRSYYVLYRQMHRDMLEGLDEQQMMSSEAHAQVNSRGALGQLFGQGPNSSVDLRAGEGKSIRDGELEIHDGRGVLRPSANDTGNRDDTLINFGLVSSSERRPVERTRGYWRSLMDRPIEQRISDVLDEISRISDVIDEITEERIDETCADLSESASEAAFERRRRDLNITDEDVQAVCGPEYTLSNIPENARPFVIKHTLKRHKARMALHERWKRRRFYTDEEEGASPPPDWHDEEDIPMNSASGETSKSHFQQRPSIHSRSSSKVRFAEDMDDFDTRSNPSTSSRSVPERWGGIEIPDAEKDVGKEILYQVTQQAYNELLDPFFRAKEDLAVAVLETKEERDKYRHFFYTEDFVKWAIAKKSEEAINLMGGGLIERRAVPNFDLNPRPAWPDIPEVEVEDIEHERRLEELLAADVFEVEELNGTNATTDAETIPESDHSHPEFALEKAVRQLRRLPEFKHDPPTAWKIYIDRYHLGLDHQRAILNAIEHLVPSYVFFYMDSGLKEKEQEHAEAFGSTGHHLSEYRDPTLPQFRPNSVADDAILQTSAASSSKVERQRIEKEEKRPSREVLYKLWEIEGAEHEGKERGGLGKINFEEFEQCVKKLTEDGKGNSMDYLGSWIEFCIP